MLRPNGLFCLDTPNQLTSKLLCRMGYLHPEHKLEYTPSHLIKMLEDAGFKVINQKAISLLPQSLKWGRFCKLELQQSEWIGDHPNEGFSFYLECKI